MSQELLQSICKTIIESNQEGSLEVLKKIISDNKSAITDETQFNIYILGCIANSLVIIKKDEKDPFSDNILDNTSFKKMKYFENMVYSMTEIPKEFNDIIIRLANYDIDSLTDSIDRMSINTENKALRKRVDECLVFNITEIAQNERLVSLVINRSNDISRDQISIIAEKLGLINERFIKLDYDFKRLNNIEEINQMRKEINSLKNSMEALIELITIIINKFGIESFDISESNISEILNASNLTNDLLSSFKSDEFISEILKSEPKLKKLYLQYLVNDLVSIGCFAEAIKFMSKMTDEEISKLESLNAIVRYMISDEEMKDTYSEVISRLAIPNLLCKLSPSSVVPIIEQTYIKEPENYEEEIKMLQSEVFEFIKVAISSENSLEHYNEKLLFSLLDSHHEFSDSIIYILSNCDIDMKFSPVSYYGPESMDYLICRLGSDEVIKELISKLPEDALYIGGLVESYDLVGLSLQADEYERALKAFDHEQFSWLDEDEIASLEQNGEYRLMYEYYGFDNPDNFTMAMRNLHEKMCKYPGLIELFKHILKSEKTKYVSLDSLNYYIPMNDDEVCNIIKDRYKNGEIIFTSLIDNELDGIDGIRIATKEEIQGICPILLDDAENKR